MLMWRGLESRLQNLLPFHKIQVASSLAGPIRVAWKGKGAPVSLAHAVIGFIDFDFSKLLLPIWVFQLSCALDERDPGRADLCLALHGGVLQTCYLCLYRFAPPFKWKQLWLS